MHALLCVHESTILPPLCPLWVNAVQVFAVNCHCCSSKMYILPGSQHRLFINATVHEWIASSQLLPAAVCVHWERTQFYQLSAQGGYANTRVCKQTLAWTGTFFGLFFFFLVSNVSKCKFYSPKCDLKPHFLRLFLILNFIPD